MKACLILRGRIKGREGYLYFVIPYGDPHASLPQRGLDRLVDMADDLCYT